MTTEDVTPQDDRIRACAIARDLESFEFLIDEMQTIFGDSWGGLEIDDALPVLSSKHAAQIEHVILGLGPDDANNLDQIIQIIDRAKASNQNVTLVTHDLSSNALHQLLRSGADDFVPYPLPKGSLEALLIGEVAPQTIDFDEKSVSEPVAQPIADPVVQPTAEPVAIKDPQVEVVTAKTVPTDVPQDADAIAQGSRLDLSSPVQGPASTDEKVDLDQTTSAVRAQLNEAAQAAEASVSDARGTISEKASEIKEEAIKPEELVLGAEDAAVDLTQDLSKKLDEVVDAPAPKPEITEQIDTAEPVENLKLERSTPAEQPVEEAVEPKAEEPKVQEEVLEKVEPAKKSLTQKVTERVAGVAPISLRNNDAIENKDGTIENDGFERLVKAAVDGEEAPEVPKPAEVQSLREPEKAEPEQKPQPVSEVPAEPKQAEPARPAVRGGKQGIVFPVYGTAGGVGASTFATNLAWEMQSILEKEGRTVCIIDLALQYGSVATYLDVPRSDATMELLTNMASADEQALQGSMKFHKDKMAVFPSPVDPVPLELIDPQDIGQLIDLATSAYDIVIIDMPNTLTSWTETVLDRAKLFFAFCEMEMRSAQNALRFLRALKSEELPYEKVQFVINRAPKMTDLAGRSRIKRMSDSLNVEFRFLLPDGGKQVVSACDQGSPLATMAGRNPLRKEIRKIAEKMAELTTEEADVKASA